MYKTYVYFLYRNVYIYSNSFIYFLRPGALNPQIFRLTPLMTRVTTLKSKWGESVLWALLPLGSGEFWKERGLCLQVKGQEV